MGFVSQIVLRILIRFISRISIRILILYVSRVLIRILIRTAALQRRYTALQWRCFLPLSHFLCCWNQKKHNFFKNPPLFWSTIWQHCLLQRRYIGATSALFLTLSHFLCCWKQKHCCKDFLKFFQKSSFALVNDFVTYRHEETDNVVQYSGATAALFSFSLSCICCFK